MGVDDPGGSFLGAGGRINLPKAMEGLRPDLFPILLTHRPTGFEQARDRKIPLTLCGHTHGGQIGVPGLPNLAALAYHYTHGLYRKGSAPLDSLFVWGFRRRLFYSVCPPREER